MKGSLYQGMPPYLLATLTGVAAVALLWCLFVRTGDRKTRLRLLPYCVLTSLQTLLLPLADIFLGDSLLLRRLGNSVLHFPDQGV